MSPARIKFTYWMKVDEFHDTAKVHLQFYQDDNCPITLEEDTHVLVVLTGSPSNLEALQDKLDGTMTRNLMKTIHELSKAVSPSYKSSRDSISHLQGK